MAGQQPQPPNLCSSFDCPVLVLATAETGWPPSVRPAGPVPCRPGTRGPSRLLGDAAFAAEDGSVAVGLAYHRGPRLDLLPPVRDYAKRQCPPAEVDAARWCRHFLDRTRTEGERILGDGGAEALTDLTPEIANIDAALRAAPGPVAARAGGGGARGCVSTAVR